MTAFERPEALLVPMREAPATVMDERGLTYLHSRGESRLYDVGQNMVGIVTATLRGDAGAVVRFRYGEMLNGDGTLYTDNLRSAQATDLFTLCGEGDELFSPLFTFHGFRYVEITVLSGRCEVSDLRAEVIYSNLRRTGEFSCSDPIVNQIYSNAFWGQRGNFVYIPTDCPQRDEQLGWTGYRRCSVSRRAIIWTQMRSTALIWIPAGTSAWAARSPMSCPMCRSSATAMRPGETSSRLCRICSI